MCNRTSHHAVQKHLMEALPLSPEALNAHMLQSGSTLGEAPGESAEVLKPRREFVQAEAGDSRQVPPIDVLL